MTVKRTLAAGFFLFLFSFTSAIVAIMLLISGHQSHLIMARMESLASVSVEQKLVYSRLADEGEDRFLAVGFYVFITGFMASLFFGNRFLKAVKDLHSAAVAINSGDAARDIFITEPSSGAGELSEIAAAMNRLSGMLRDREEALALKNRYVDMMLDALWVINKKNLVADINPAFTELLGYERDDIIGFPVFDFMDEKSERALRKHMASSEDGVCPSCELMLISKNGDMVPAMASWAPFQAYKSENAVRLGILRDFRREAGFRETLREAAEYQQAFMDSMPMPFLVADEGLDIIMSNKAAKDWAGGDPDRGKTCAPNGKTCASVNCPVKMVFKTGRPQIGDCSSCSEKIRGQSSAFYEIMAYPVKNGRGLVKHATVVIRDVTGQKRTREETDRKERELAGLLDFSAIVNGSLRGEDVFTPALKKLVELTCMDGACLFLPDEMGEGLSGKYHTGPLSGFFRENGTFSIEKMGRPAETRRVEETGGTGGDIPGRAASGNPFTTDDLSSDPRAEKSVFRQTGIRACAAFPMHGKEKKITGVLLLFSFSKHEWRREEEDMIIRAARMAGMSLENIRLYENMRHLCNQLKREREEKQNEGE